MSDIGRSNQRPEPRPANQRGAARLAAVQALYQLEIGGEDIVAVVTEFEAHRLGKEIDGVEYRQADAAWFRDIVAGVVGEQRRLDPMIHTALVEDWPLKRVDATLRAILRCGAYELSKRPDVPGRVIITEYIDIARAFFGDDEPKLVNGVLDRLAHDLRPDEFPAVGAKP
ncbi:transcription antitermination factor NusB [Oharaeibacter diazotrophicus]|uniref:Transcription antitermination protein NusB n=1 Tax=Oharaeibacter diazotrophicus TaxID=1920512 RepID=A0A4R6RJ26_9HYPH|nr:transcription antitermination factor NusB [Oharaeibacter diazotrophicus]TDP86503.1 NusB antitermination factor [Oharaeibacter diazotrophicus]BBE71555.1 N utilization substance protein B [Pleomorphomonas sp. SM30]GLS78315.1 N utilization substance protein B [Oharaeibacter diazotrophicus]